MSNAQKEIVQLTGTKRIAGGSCYFEKNGSTLKQIVEKMVDGKAVSKAEGGQKLTVLQSGHLGCSVVTCQYNRLFGVPDKDKGGEYRFCKLLEIDHAAAWDIHSHVRNESLKKQMEERHAKRHGNHPGWKNLEKYQDELEIINKQ